MLEVSGFICNVEGVRFFQDLSVWRRTALEGESVRSRRRRLEIVVGALSRAALWLAALCGPSEDDLVFRTSLASVSPPGCAAEVLPFALAASFCAAESMRCRVCSSAWRRSAAPLPLPPPRPTEWWLAFLSAAGGVGIPARRLLDGAAALSRWVPLPFRCGEAPSSFFAVCPVSPRSIPISDSVNVVLDQLKSSCTSIFGDDSGRLFLSLRPSCLPEEGLAAPLLAAATAGVRSDESNCVERPVPEVSAVMAVSAEVMNRRSACFFLMASSFVDAACTARVSPSALVGTIRPA
mmetsp:Transcript_32671/g.60123  ORF Transcript_32671/g.60123 Transcript_32671/m.60123 type:complete len:293 (+) Transcript_32671:537-1415(+)